MVLSCVPAEIGRTLNSKRPTTHHHKRAWTKTPAWTERTRNTNNSSQASLEAAMRRKLQLNMIVMRAELWSVQMPIGRLKVDMRSQSMLDPLKSTPTCRSRNSSTPTYLERNAWLTTKGTLPSTKKAWTLITWVYRRLLFRRAAKLTASSDSVPAAMKKSIKTTRQEARNKGTFPQIYSTDQ